MHDAPADAAANTQRERLKSTEVRYREREDRASSSVKEIQAGQACAVAKSTSGK